MSDLVGQRLATAEAVIARGLNTFIEVGNALRRIRDERLYADDYGTFEDYCGKRWGFTDRRARQIMDSAEIVAALPTGTIVPVTESQARELTGLDPDTAADVMDLAASSGKVTAATIRDARNDITGVATITTTTVEHVDTGTGEILAGPTLAGRAAADRAMDAISDFISSDVSYRQAVLVKDLSNAIGKWRPPVDMDPVEAASLPVRDADLLLMKNNIADLHDWVSAFNAARSSGLRLISGGK